MFRAILLVLGAAILLIGALMLREQNFGEGGRDTTLAIAEPAREIALVSNAVEGTLSLIDIEARTMIATLNIIPDGAKVSFFRDPIQSFAQDMVESRAGLNYAQDSDLSLDGTVVFVSRGYLGDVAALDLVTGEILWRTPIAGIRADHMDLSPDGTRLYVAALLRSGDVVEVLDSATGRKVGSFETGIWPHDVHTSKDGQRIYTASLGNMELPLDARTAEENAYSITITDADSFDELERLPFAAGIRPFVLSEDEQTIYAQLSNSHSVIAYDVARKTVTELLNLPIADGVTEEDWDFEAPHHGLAWSRQRGRLCVAGRASDYAAIVDLDPLDLIEAVPVGDAPSWAEVTNDGQHCLLPNTRSDDVSIIDLQTAAELARIAVGRGPKHITIGMIPDSVVAQLQDAPE